MVEVQRLVHCERRGVGLNSSKRHPSKEDDIVRTSAKVGESSQTRAARNKRQNWPHSVQSFLMVDDGYVGFAIDLGQAENRIVAYYGNIVNMINAFEQGWDVHSLTATGIWPDLTWQQIKAEDEEKIACKLGNGTHTRRYFGKRSNHALNYDLGYRAYALQLEIPEKESKMIYDGYHNLYPGVKNTFHRKVRDQLRSGRVVTNLLGRKTPFLGKLDNNLFKEAYACIPQGTVGDIINSRGLTYIYENPDLFAPVELLNQVHDEIVFQIPGPWHPDHPCSWEQIAFMITMIKNSLEVPLQASGREFTIPADVTVFKRFKCGSDPKFSEDLDTFAFNIEKAWDKCDEKERKRLA